QSSHKRLRGCCAADKVSLDRCPGPVTVIRGNHEVPRPSARVACLKVPRQEIGIAPDSTPFTVAAFVMVYVPAPSVNLTGLISVTTVPAGVAKGPRKHVVHPLTVASMFRISALAAPPRSISQNAVIKPRRKLIVFPMSPLSSKELNETCLS